MGQIKSVLWIIHWFPRPKDPTVGIWAIETVRALKRRGIDPIVLVPTSLVPKWLAFSPKLKRFAETPDYLEIEGIPVFYCKCPYYPHRFVRRSLYLNFPYFEGGALWHWVKSTVNEIMNRYPVNIVHANFLYPEGRFGSLIKARYGIPLVFQERSVQGATWTNTHPLLETGYKSVLKKADAVITNNAKSYEIIRGLGASEADMFTVRSCANVDYASQYIQSRPSIYSGKKIILSVGSFTKPRKGQEYLIRAVKELTDSQVDIHCILIGSGVLLKRAKNLVVDLGLSDRIEFFGQCSHKKVLNTMSWCDVFVLPSWDEGFGTAYSEAMSFGKPIIASEGEGISQVVENMKQGILVKPKEILELAQAIEKILSDAILAGNLGAAAKSLVEQELNYDALADNLASIYCHAVDRFKQKNNELV